MPRLPQLLLALALLSRVGAALARGQTESAADRLAAEARAAFSAGDRERSAELFEATAKASDDPQQRAAALNNACSLRNDLAQFTKALPLCERAVAQRREQQDPVPLARALNNLGLALLNLGRVEPAEKNLVEAATTQHELGDLNGEVTALSNLANVYQAAGRYAEADDLMQHIDGVLRGIDEPWAAQRRYAATINRAVLLERLARYDAAREALAELLAEPELDARWRAFASSNLAVVLRNLGDSVRALELLEQARDAYRRLGDRGGELNALLNQARTNLENRADPKAAMPLLEQALALARETGDRPQESEVLLQLGVADRAQGELDDAATHLQAALATSRQAGRSEGVWQSQAELGRLARDRGDLERARELLLAACEEIDRVQRELSAQRTSERYLAAQRGVFESLVSVLAALDRSSGDQSSADSDNATQAFLWAIRAKQRQLADRLALTQERTAQPTLASIQQRLSPRQTLIELFAAEGSLYRWVVTQHGISMTRDEGLERILQRAQDVQEALAEDVPVDAQALETLGATLLSGLPEGCCEELLIAPDRRLRYLPFEALPLPSRSGSSTPTTPLVRRARVRYLPSGLALLDAPSQEHRRHRLPLLALGNVDVPGRAPLPATAREMQQVAERLGGTVLSGPAATFAAVRELATGAATGGSNAGSTGTGDSGAGARDSVGVLHFATHTELDERSGNGSSILLAPEPEPLAGLASPPRASQAVSSAQIAAQHLEVDLTVLSACSTTLGLERDGEGLETLAGAFLAAGSRGVVASLWDVGDENTASFMEQFYYYLARGNGAAEALRRAKLRLLDDPRWSDPALWSAFVLIGESPRVASPPVLDSGAARLVLAGALALCLVWLGISLLKRR